MTDELAAIAKKRRDRERLARIDLIRNAAARVFARYGYEQATMSQVAREAEMGKASLYHYFNTKQDLFADIVQHATEELAEGLKDVASQDGDPLFVLEEICHFTLGYCREHRERLALFLPLIAGGPARLRSMVGESIALEIGAHVAISHAPLFRALQPLALRMPEGERLPHLLASLLVGMLTKVLHGGLQDLEAELGLFLHLVRKASE